MYVCVCFKWTHLLQWTLVENYLFLHGTEAGCRTNFACDHILIFLDLLNSFSRSIFSNWLRRWSKFSEKMCLHSLFLTESWGARIMGKSQTHFGICLKSQSVFAKNHTCHFTCHRGSQHLQTWSQMLALLGVRASSPRVFPAEFSINVQLQSTGPSCRLSKGDADVAPGLAHQIRGIQLLGDPPLEPGTCEDTACWRGCSFLWVRAAGIPRNLPEVRE